MKNRRRQRRSPVYRGQVPDNETVTSEDRVHLEWWYDLEQPILAHVDLLSARPSYTTSLSTEDGTFDATVLLPTTTEDRAGHANYLEPPRNWTATTRERDEAWGTDYRHAALGLEGVAIRRLAFAIEVGSSQVPPAIGPEWGPDLLAQSILHSIDDWWDNVRTWIEIATNQRLTHVGHQAEDPLNPNTRTEFWMVDEDGTRRKLPVGGTVLQGSDRILSTTPEILQDCLALATTTPPLAWTLLRDARALQNADQYRRAVIDAATAAELAATTLIDSRLQGQDEAARARTIKRPPGLQGKKNLLGKLGVALPESFTTQLVYKRNDAVHQGVDIHYSEWAGAFREAMDLVQRAFPLPTAPGSAKPLTCHWQQSTLDQPLQLPHPLGSIDTLSPRTQP